MKKHLIAATVLCVVSGVASATTGLFGDTVNNNQTYGGTANGGQATATGNGYGGQGGQGGAGGTGGRGGDGGNASVLGSGNSSNLNTNANTNLQGQGQGQQQGQGQGQLQGQVATGGASNATNTATNTNGSVSGSVAGSVDGRNTQTNGSNTNGDVRGSNTNGATGSGNVTNVRLGDSSYQEAAQAATAYAPNIPTVATSCRLYISLGGAGSSTSTTASASGGIPIGNDQTCLSGTSLKIMAAMNEAAKQAGQSVTFSAADFKLVACKIEGLKETSGCAEAPAAKQVAAAPAATPIMMPVVAKADDSHQYTDPIIRARLGLPPLRK